MRKNVLITGGAGFIGSHLADELIAHGHRVRALDVLLSQVHGPGQRRPSYLHRDVDLVVGDVRDREAVEAALDGIDVVYHFAAMVGVGQSMYQMVDYVSVNNVGTAVLLEALSRRKIERLVVASSMSVYGEGLYRAGDGRVVEGVSRDFAQLKEGRWELVDGAGGTLEPVPTPETKSCALESIYALSKHDQETMCLVAGRAYGIPTVALRFFNVYGPRQALSNPYTGVLAIFASRLLNRRRPLIFEDGLQKRDFVSVYDVVRACRLALSSAKACGHVINVGSGTARTVRHVADQMAEVMNTPHLRPELTGKYRVGDVRHCFADIGKARALLGYEPAIEFGRGIADLAIWLRGQVARDRVAEAKAELDSRGLTL